MLVNYLTRLMLIRETYITFPEAIMTIKLFFSLKKTYIYFKVRDYFFQMDNL